MLANEEKEREEEILAKIERGETYEDDELGGSGPAGFLGDGRVDRNADDLATV